MTTATIQPNTYVTLDYVLKDDSGEVLDESNRRAVSDTLQNVRSITGALVEPSRDVGEVVNNANQAVVELRSLFRKLEQSYVEKGGLKDQLSQTLGDADRLAKNLIDASRQIQLLIQENRPGIRDFTHNTLNQLGDLVCRSGTLTCCFGCFA